ncbi:hypothetical protein GWK53_08750 [Burkholderia cepacia]|uniref:hypothetical protein n=1 Tax=Burkholderia cepacia TaxID=292 RepID=UPI0013F41EEC|nr:hypothetical protein [Burkholderia cepacia]NHB06598.1 hypothetical protein [Burkholderia cepacia]
MMLRIRLRNDAGTTCPRRAFLFLKNIIFLSYLANNKKLATQTNKRIDRNHAPPFGSKNRQSDHLQSNQHPWNPNLHIGIEKQIFFIELKIEDVTGPACRNASTPT